MTIVNVHEAKSTLSKLLEQALRGEEVVIAKAGKPLVRLTPVGSANREPRKPGMLAHLYGHIDTSCLLEPMSLEELAEWEDGPAFPEDDEPVDKMPA